MLDRYAVIGGKQVKHSLSPKIHQAFAQQTGQSLQYEAIPVEYPTHVIQVLHSLQQRGFKGLNVTMPYKEQVFHYLKERSFPLSERAQNAKAVNTLLFLERGVWQGDNTDGIGFIRDVANNLAWEMSHKRVLIFGAGGAARGVVAELMRTKPQQIVIANRTLLRGRQLVEELGYQDKIAVSELIEIKPGQYDLSPSFNAIK